ncbi:MAG: AAA family ATPase [Actinomycetes bacterium]
MLIVMAGLPGSGKSVLAAELGRRLRAPVLSVDPVEAAMLRSGVDRSQPTGLAAYVVVEAVADHTLRLGQTVVVDAVNDAPQARDQWSGLAARHDVALRYVEVRCGDPRTHRERLERRLRDLPELPEPSWTSVEARRAALESWDGERLVLDSREDVGALAERVLDHLEAA